MKASVLALCALLLGTAACADRSHLSSGYGDSYRMALARQAANPEAGERPATQGLDSQEASLIAHAYRAALAPKGQTVAQEPILLVSPSAQKGRSGDYMPPASVPPER